ncbi:HupE/UreJ family protein [Rhodophyticola sp. DY48A3-103]|nr:HupE/UreJ family protein [Alterinioella nitratireducens]
MFPFNLARISALSILLFVSVAPGAQSHEIDPGISDVAVSAEEVVIELRMAVESILADIDLSEVTETTEAPEEGAYDRFRAMEPQALAEEMRAFWPQMADNLMIVVDGQRLTPEFVGIEVPEVGNFDLARTSTLTFRADLPEGDAPVQFGWAEEYGELVVRQADAGEDAYAGFLAGGELSEPLPRGEIATEGAGAVFLRYIVVGFEHIVPKGLDHILFVLGLFFFSLQLRPILFQVTAFTLAHTITLALASLEIISVPASVVEPLIALSIVYVGVENVLGFGSLRSRTALVFAFGLLHGLGFASVLGDVGIDPTRFITALVGFNIGVEFGQLAVIFAAFLLVGYWFGRKGWYRARIAVPASLFIALIGAWWSVERVFL